MNSEHTSHYIHGTHPEEQQRLALLNDLLNEQALQELQLRGGEKILDLGSGLGQFSRAMARIAGPTGRVVGVERSDEQLAKAKMLAERDGEQSLVDFRKGDAFSLPLRGDEWTSFDVAHTRFLLEHVSDPLGVVRAMVQAVRPGGRIVLQDDDHDVLRVWPEIPKFYDLWAAYMQTYIRLNNDPYIGRRLSTLIYQAGALPVRNTLLFFGSCAGNPNFPLYVENLVGVVGGAREAVVSNHLMSSTDVEEALDNVRSWAERPDAGLWYAVFWAEGIKR